MKWINHKIITGSLIYAATNNLFVIIPAVLGSVFPDMVEGRFDAENTQDYEKWKRRHRKISHWFIPYLVVSVLIVAIYKSAIVEISINTFFSSTFSSIKHIIATNILFFCIGCLLHIAQDAICGKVPSVNPKKRIGIKAFKVGSIIEYLLAGVIVSAVVW